jgi:hypothetical protein
MALSDHLRLALLIDGVFQIKPSSVSINGESGAQAVETLEGLAGKTQGSGRCTISVSGAVPLGGLEFDCVSALSQGTYHEMQVPLGGKSYVGNGWINSASVSQSVNANTEYSFEWIGELKPLE